MNAGDRREIEAIANAIVRHLHTHPLATDSALGVARWWLGPPLDSAPLEQVEQALEGLVAKGVLRRLRLSDGGVLYSQVLPTQQ